MIRVCKFNKYNKEVSEYLASKNIAFSVGDCLGRCDLCHSGAFVQYDDEFISAENGEVLILKLEALNIL